MGLLAVKLGTNTYPKQITDETKFLNAARFFVTDKGLGDGTETEEETCQMVLSWLVRELKRNAIQHLLENARQSAISSATSNVNFD